MAPSYHLNYPSSHLQLSGIAGAQPGETSSLPRQRSGVGIVEKPPPSSDGIVLKQKLQENEKKLTETKLQYLSSAHQIDQMKDEMISLKNELDMLRNENEKLANQAIAGSRCSPSGSSITSSNCANCRHSSSESCSASDLQHSNSDLCLSVLLDNTISNTNLQDVFASQALSDHTSLKIVRVKIKLGNPRDDIEPRATSFYAGALGVTPNTHWQMMDAGVTKIFTDYLLRIDSNHLGLSVDSLKCWTAGKDVMRVVRSSSDTPTNDIECSPFEYFGNEKTSPANGNDQPNTVTTNMGDASNSCVNSSNTYCSVVLHLKDTDSCCDRLVFETCIPKPHLQRYFNQWVEFKKLVFIGPPGTGKSYVAQKLIHLLLSDSSDQKSAKTVSLNMDLEDVSELKKSVKKLLSSEAESASESSNSAKTILFIENLHSLGSQLSEALSILSNLKPSHRVYTITTMTSRPNQSYPQLQKVFPRWVVFNNHNEPLAGLIGRYLRRQLVEFENRNGGLKNSLLIHIVEWLPKVWQHVNRLIEHFNNAEVTLGPHLFFSCPMDPNSAQSWFNTLWNYSLAPYLMEAIREGLQLYGAKAGTHWEDPVTWVEQTYPWNLSYPCSVTCGGEKSGSVATSENSSPTKSCPPLIRIRKEDVAFDKVSLRATCGNE